MAPVLESPLNTAHQHVQNAEEYGAQGLLIPAAEEHRKAAEAFQVCLEQATDDQHKRTMRMLYNDQRKLEKELQRRIEKLKAENKDPTLPQKPAQPHVPVASPSFDMGTYSPRAAPSPPPYTRGRMMDSQATVDESFMVLGGRSDPGDDFAKFWTRMQAMQDLLEQPLAVAFATAPLGEEKQKGVRREGSSSSDNTDVEEPMTTRFARKMGITRGSRSRILSSAMNVAEGSSKAKNVDFGEEFDEDTFADDNDDLSESFYVIPGGPEPSISSLKKENASLKDQVDAMRLRLAQAERVLKLRKEQDMQLRDSIVMARQQAQRAMGASVLGPQRPGQPPMDFSSLNINVPPVPPPITPLNPARDREVPQLLRKVRELEEEVRNVRAENEKQKVMITKFRERWEKLKESAKRKKDAKAAAAQVSGMAPVGERIDEEPEVEAEET